MTNPKKNVRQALVTIEVSARHVHLTVADSQRLFGSRAIQRDRFISQRPQFIARQRVTLVGPQGAIERVGIVGPFRRYTQVELAATDAHRLGLQPPVAASGDQKNAAPVVIRGPRGQIRRRAAILQQRHLHINDLEARRLGLSAGRIVRLTIGGPRGGVLDKVLVRVSPSFRRRIHLDTDEANALGVRTGSRGTFVTGK